MKYMLLTSTGTGAPRYEHDTFKSAQEEAYRLCKLHNCSVKILAIVGTVILEHVPVVELKPVLMMHSQQTQSSDDLPF